MIGKRKWMSKGEGMVSRISCFNPTSRSGPDGYINYKMSGGDNLGSGGGLGCDLFGWGCIILFVLYIIGKLFG